jgi:hypothetical protein
MIIIIATADSWPQRNTAPLFSLHGEAGAIETCDDQQSTASGSYRAQKMCHLGVK